MVVAANARNNYLSSLDFGNGDKIECKYDKANQLIRENNQEGGYTHVWTYDDAGNILTRTEYAYTTDTLGAATDTIAYSYGNVWGDLLTAYDGQAISYDGVGNPNGIGTQSYTWKHGRQLATLTENGVTWTYTYNADGLRTSRTNGTDTYSYVYNGSNLTQMTKGTDTLYFSYDASGTPMTVTWNGTVYYYVTNIQGDVIAILNSSGATVASYAYDAWGNPIGTAPAPASGTLAYLNPLRYRSYVYDQETTLYYLQSRYYASNIGRFINADAFASTSQGILSNDMFAYCLNNPANYADYSGKWTIAFGGSGNVNLGFGIALSRQIVIDSEGNIAYQTSYAVPGVNDTISIGAMDAGAGGFLQFTGADSYRNLEGHGTAIGFSAGAELSFGIDAIELASIKKTAEPSPPDNPNYPDGFQVSLGAGIGVDVHIVDSYTETKWSFNIIEAGEVAWDFVVGLFT